MSGENGGGNKGRMARVLQRAAPLLPMITRYGPVFGVRGGDIAVRFVFNLALARALGAEASGNYYLALSIITLAASLARLGFDSAAVKFIAVAHEAQDQARVRGIALLVLGHVLVAGLALSLLLWFGAEPIARAIFDNAAFAPVLRAFSFGAAVLALEMAVAALLSGLGRPLISQIVGTILWPALVLPFLALGPLSGARVAAIAVGAMAAATLLGLVVLARACRGGRALSFIPTRALAVTGLPLFGTEMIFLLFSNLPVLALGYFATPADVGLFAVASRISLLLAVFVVATGVVAAPGFARLYAGQRMLELEGSVHEATRVVGLAAITTTVVIVAAPGPLLALFGPGFETAAPMLVLMVLGQLVASLFAASTSLLSMTGGERALWRAALVSFCVLAALVLALVPLWAGTGAAIATAAGTASFGITAALAVRKRLGINLLRAYWPGKG